MVFRIVILVLVGALSMASLPTPAGFGAAAGGAVLGALLAVYALRHTEYEVTPEAEYYKTNAWFGLGVLALFLGRLGARMAALYINRGALIHAQPGMPESPFSGTGMQKSPVTLGIFFLMAGYFIVYNAGLLRKHASLVKR